MDKILSSISTPEGLIGVALTMAFILILFKPVRDMVKGGDDVVVSSLEELARVMNGNTTAIKEQHEQFKANNVQFSQTLTSLAGVQTTLTNIHTELVRANK